MPMMNGWEVVSKIWRFQNSTFDAINDTLSARKLHPKSVAVLDVIRTHKYPNEVARVLGVPMPTLSNILRELERNAYVVRTTDLEDRRKVVLSITKEGLVALNESVEAVNRHLEPRLTKIGEEQKTGFHEFFDGIQGVDGAARS